MPGLSFVLTGLPNRITQSIWCRLPPSNAHLLCACSLELRHSKDPGHSPDQLDLPIVQLQMLPKAPVQHRVAGPDCTQAPVFHRPAVARGAPGTTTARTCLPRPIDYIPIDNIPIDYIPIDLPCVHCRAQTGHPSKTAPPRCTTASRISGPKATSLSNLRGQGSSRLPPAPVATPQPKPCPQ